MLKRDPAAAPTDWRAFIRDNTKLLAPPLVPEIVLHLAEESLPIWQKTEEELGQLGLPPPYWAFAWAGGQALARYLLDHGAQVSSRRVLDLGSGSGLAAIAAKKAGAALVLAAEIDPVGLIAAELNAGANNAILEMTSEDLLSTTPAAWDLVLAGDLFYERALAERVLGFLDRAVAVGADVLVGDPQRSYFAKHRFAKIAEYRVPVTRELEDAEIKLSAVWRLEPR